MQAEQAVEEIERDALEGLVKLSAQRLPGRTLCLVIEGLDRHLQQRERQEFRAIGECQLPLPPKASSMALHLVACVTEGFRSWSSS